MDKYKMKKIIWTLVLIAASLSASQAQNSQFLPGHLAVLRAGDGSVPLKLKQSPVFIDQFDPNLSNGAPSVSVAVPTNGANAFFFNGHAATEGMLSRSVDGRQLVFAGYGGVNLLAQPGTPAMLDIKRGFCTVDVAGNLHTLQYEPANVDDKMNPRGAATDGNNNFWGCGNANANLYYNAGPGHSVVVFESVQSARAVKIINHVLYTTLNGPDGTVIDQPAGIYQFVDKTGASVALPQTPDVALKLVVPAAANYTKIAGFDISPDRTVAYTADTVAGVQKYVNTGGAWKFAYNFAIPQTISTNDNHAAGCFGLVVDFKGPAPVIYATTTEGYNGTVNSNRVIRIVDTNATATVSTVAQSGSDNIAFRGIDFTPDSGH